MIDGAFVYILRCADGSYYCGTARQGLEMRVAEHNAGTPGGYTSTRRPVVLIYSEWFQRITDAIAAEQQIKGQEGSADPWRVRRVAGAVQAIDKAQG
jgi:putative endonuclease